MALSNTAADGRGTGDFNPLSIPEVSALAARLAEADGLTIEARNFRSVALTAPTTGYRRDKIVIRFSADGAVKIWRADGKASEIAPTEDEAAAIRAAFAKLKLPKSMAATKSNSKQQRFKLGVAKEDWFEMLDAKRDAVPMCQQRINDKDGVGKKYMPWTYFNDGQWRCMEPDSDWDSDLGHLPMWKPDTDRQKTRIMIHEGAKAARFVDALLHDPDKRDALARHPWAADLADYEHWGWIGGAPNPRRTDWSELSRVALLLEVAVVTDHDANGERAIVDISRCLKRLDAPLWEVQFDDGFPVGFDMADELPKHHWKDQRWIGPALRDLYRSATWATRILPMTKKGKGSATRAYALRDAFIGQWFAVLKPAVFVHVNDPGRQFDGDEFNRRCSAFSEVENTARLVWKEAARVIDGVAYEPGRNSGRVNIDGRRMINTWAPTRVGRAKGDVTPFLEFMAHLIPGERDRDVVPKWIATLIARPAVRMRYGLLMISEVQGVGKGTLMEKILRPLVGHENTSVPSEKQLTKSDFNPWAARKRLVLVHEIYAGEVKKAYDTIKSTLTDDYVTVNEKNTKEYVIRNWTHYFLASNSSFALRLVKNDRRWFVPEVTELKRSPQYWIDFNAWLVNGGLEMIHQWACDYVAKHGAVSTADDPPASEAKERLIRTSRSEGEQLAYDLGETAMAATGPVTFIDRSVREWIAGERGLLPNDRHLESPATIRSQLKAAGMQQVVEYMSRGTRFAIFANQAAVEQLSQYSGDERREAARKMAKDAADLFMPKRPDSPY
jgi:hypothetical protein